MPHGPRSAFAYRTYWIILHGITCWLVGRRIPIRLVDFRCAEPKQGADYRLFFGAPVRFSQTISLLASTAPCSTCRWRAANTRSNSSCAAHPPIFWCAIAMMPVSPPPSMRRLNLATPSAWSRFTELAADMRMPPSTLRHRLHDEGQSYAAIKDDIRRDLAVELLLNTSMSIGEIAVQLGYSEPSAFFRAFRKWMGKSPEVFRREEALSQLDEPLQSRTL